MYSNNKKYCDIEKAMLTITINFCEKTSHKKIPHEEHNNTSVRNIYDDLSIKKRKKFFKQAKKRRFLQLSLSFCNEIGLNLCHFSFLAHLLYTVDERNWVFKALLLFMLWFHKIFQRTCRTSCRKKMAKIVCAFRLHELYNFYGFFSESRIYVNYWKLQVQKW